jgi:hypothetical protein
MPKPEGRVPPERDAAGESLVHEVGHYLRHMRFPEGGDPVDRFTCTPITPRPGRFRFTRKFA